MYLWGLTDTGAEAVLFFLLFFSFFFLGGAIWEGCVGVKDLVGGGARGDCS